MQTTIVDSKTPSQAKFYGGRILNLNELIGFNSDMMLCVRVFL